MILIIWYDECMIFFYKMECWLNWNKLILNVFEKRKRLFFLKECICNWFLWFYLFNLNVSDNEVFLFFIFVFRGIIRILWNWGIWKRNFKYVYLNNIM